ncbi:MAG: amino acid ABC transporter substrate-binding protein, partial [Nanoarchaeota archaeon]
MKDKRVLLICTILVLGLFLIYGCGGITGKATAVGVQPKIKIGAILPLSGDAAAYGENVKQGIELALQGT